MQMSTGFTLDDIARVSDEAQTASITVDASETNHYGPEITTDDATDDADDATVVSGQPVVLKASANNANFDLVQFNWRQLTGPTVTITDADSATISFTAPEVYSTKKLILEVTADDGRDVVSSIVTCTVMAIENKPDEDLQRHTGSFSWLALLFGSLRKT